MLASVTSDGGRRCTKYHLDKIEAGTRASLMTWIEEGKDRNPNYELIRLRLAFKVANLTLGLSSNDVSFFSRRIRKLIPHD